MATNLVLLYPDIPFRGKVTRNDWDSNIICGSRTTISKAAAGITKYFEVDLGDGNSSDPNYCYLARADLTARDSDYAVTVTIKGSNDSDFSTGTQLSTTHGADLDGPWSEDWIYSPDLAPWWASSYRFWRFQYDTGDLVEHKIALMYLGEWFDFGRDPLYEPLEEIPTIKDGHRYVQRHIRLRWTGIDHDTKIDFHDKIGKHRATNLIVLHDINAYIFQENLICCEIENVRYELTTPEYWRITLDLIEQI